MLVGGDDCEDPLRAFRPEQADQEIKTICRELRVSRKVVRKVIRSLFAHRGKPGWHSRAVFESASSRCRFRYFVIMRQAVEERGCYLGTAKPCG
jgi:hypothetical protein